MSSTMLTLDRIAALFDGHGAAYYGGEAVTQTQHALQCARLAELAGEPPALVAAALLHDIGHLMQMESRTEDMRHQEVASRALAPLLGPEVTEPIRLHVAAKRYLCAVDAAYHAGLSPASRHSLALQGGPFDERGASAFLSAPYAQDAVTLRRLDDLGKDPAMRTPELAHFFPLLERLLRIDGHQTRLRSAG